MMNEAKTALSRAHLFSSRRGFLARLASGIFLCSSGATFAEELVQTPRQTQGPFYPDRLPLDTDNDLLIINDSITPAVGAVTYLSGRILDARGEPVRGAVVEIWQVDNNGAYIHSGGANFTNRDPNFQGFGRFLTGSTGEYLFRTIRPVPYPGRTPHIHVAVKVKGRSKFTTQCYIKGHPQNAGDGVLGGIQDPRQRAVVMVPFVPIQGSRLGELAAHFDIVLGFTPTA
ncbi:MAG TPA: protocatechuate 3,4-dioxygenase [Chthonomonadaceae bacterium]|nr:protocatechuate 3,4-dioxygenase [Chthonomonadaceae bacterium]